MSELDALGLVEWIEGRLARIAELDRLLRSYDDAPAVIREVEQAQRARRLLLRSIEPHLRELVRLARLGAEAEDAVRSEG